MENCIAAVTGQGCTHLAPSDTRALWNGPAVPNSSYQISCSLIERAVQGDSRELLQQVPMIQTTKKTVWTTSAKDSTDIPLDGCCSGLDRPMNNQVKQQKDIHFQCPYMH